MTCVCGHCHAELRSRPDTTRDGTMIEVVDPCPRCKLRIIDRRPIIVQEAPTPPKRVERKPIIDANGYAICVKCGSGIGFKVGSRRGRIPVYCFTCNPHTPRGDRAAIKGMTSHG